MDFVAKNRSLIITLAVIILIAAVYLTFFSGGSVADVSTSSASSPSELFFANLEGELNPIAFDTTILSDPRFAALIDIRTAILPETSGRPDPFAPIPGVAAQ